MMESRRAVLVALTVIGILGPLLLVSGTVRAQTTQPSNALVTIVDTFDPTTSGGNISYKITGKNDGSVRSCPVPPSGCSDKPTLEAEIPAGATFVSCKTTATFTLDAPVLCTVAGAIVTAQFRTVPAHATVTMNLVIKAPIITAQTTINLRAKFSGESMRMDEKSELTTILPPSTQLSMSPSGTIVLIACGYTLDNALFGPDTEGTLMDTMNCNSGSGLTLTASGKTLNLGINRILSSSRVTGNVGITVGPNATNVTIKGGGTSGTGGRGIEQFEYCVKDLGGNAGLQITDLRCFGAKTVGILSLSNGVSISKSLIDRTKPDSSSEIPGVGGIGIQAGGDNIHAKDTIIRRSGCDVPSASGCTSIGIGFWAYGIDADGDGVVATYDGNTTTSRIENNLGIGVLLSGGPHRIKDTQVLGDDFETGVSQEGIVVEAGARGTSLDGVVVKKHRGDGIHVESGATDTIITRTNVEEIGGNGFVIDAQTTLNGNSAKKVVGHGFVVNTSATLTSNNVEECTGTGFVINGPAIIDGNSAANNTGHGFVVTNLSPGSVSTALTVQGAGDFDNNGSVDILWRDTSGASFLWLMSGSSPSTTISLGTVGTDWTVAGVGDFDGNGKADILWRHTSGALFLWLMNGTSASSTASLGTVGTDWTIARVADFNGDGKADILWRHTSGALFMWLMNGTSASSTASLGTVGTDWMIAGAADFNGDGKADILWRHTSGALFMWLMNGTTASSTASLGTVGTDWTIPRVADFNGDSRADILWRNTSGALFIWLMNGTSAISTGAPPSLGTEWTLLEVGDFNRDAKADILWRHTSGAVSTWLMNGTSLLTTFGRARLRSNNAEGNALDGFRVSGSGNALDSNSAKANDGQGFTITGTGNVLNTNGAERSVGAEFAIASGNVDDGSNTANGTRFSFPAAGGTFE